MQNMRCKQINDQSGCRREERERERYSIMGTRAQIFLQLRIFFRVIQLILSLTS